MKVAFYYAKAGNGFTDDSGYVELAENMIQSAQVFSYQVVQLTDKKTKALTKTVKRFDIHPLLCSWNSLYVYYKYVHEYLDEDTVFLDSDTLVLRSLDSVFEEEFDVGLTWRDFNPPYNSGAIYVKPGKGARWFFTEALKQTLSIPTHKRQWGVDQPAYWSVVGTKAPGSYTLGQMKLRVFPCSTHNYSPSSFDEKPKDQFIWHLKGRRKAYTIGEGKLYQEID
tara:strand:- start:103 stop:774 length:672 start_codon:yes stop_codon:yes gene_type:complete